MASPDITPYVDLTLYDKSPAEILEESKRYARVVLPEFAHHPGSIEDAILQATSLMTSELMGSINRMGSGAVEVILQLLGITRNSGTSPTGSLTVTMTDSLGHVLPAGTRFGYRDNADPNNPILYTFDTDEELTITPGNNSGTVDISGVFRATYPQLESGQTLQLLTPVAFVESAVLTTDLNVGSNPETDAEYFSRAIATLNSYSQALVLPDQFDHYVLANYSDVHRAKTYSRVDPADDLISGWTPSNGFVTVYVSRIGGASLSTTAMTEIEEDLAERATAGLDINVVPAHLEAIDVVVGFKVKSGYAGATVRDAIEVALSAYISPNHWDWNETIYLFEIVSLVDGVEGVERVVSVTLDGNAADYTFTRFGTLPVGSFTVNQV